MNSLIISLLLFTWNLAAQSTYFPTDTLRIEDLKLEKINFRYGHTYQFKTEITNDSIFWIMPKDLPKGYYEAYYNNDTNRLALVYYKEGARTYCQQFYTNGSMKSDTEYNVGNEMHGLHVLYDRNGEEIWHAVYSHGFLEPQYDLYFLEFYNQTEKLLQNKKAFGIYEFLPTPSRGRKERIYLSENQIFEYEYSTDHCEWCYKNKGIWKQEGNFIVLEIENKKLWSNPIRKFAITANKQLKNIELIEVADWGVKWYESEYSKIIEN